MLAVASCLDRIVQGQIEDSLPFADICRQSSAASWSLAQAFPADNAAAPMPRSKTAAGASGWSSTGF